MAPNAGEAVMNFLAGQGISRCYTVPGESFLELIAAADAHPDLQLISCRHESGAAFMAEADGKLTGRPAVAMATRGVGAANLSIGVHTARQDSTPMIVLLGQVETPLLGREAFQEVDLPTFYSELTVFAQTVHRADRAVETVARAHRGATTGRPGPAMVAFPADVLAEPCPPSPPFVPAALANRPSPDDAHEVARMLAEARRPVVIAGAGARGHVGRLVAAAERFGLGLYTSFRRQDAFPNTHPNYLGHLALGTPDELIAPLRDADVVLVAGSRLSEVTTQAYTLPAPHSRVIQVDAEPASIGATVAVERGIVSDVGAFLEALLASPAPATTRDWSDAHGRYDRFSTPDGGGRADDGVDPTRVVAAMRRRLPAAAVITNDAGNFAIFAHRFWRFEHPYSQAGPACGAMGYGVPAAVAAGLATPDRPAVGLVGDGGFLMTGQELETAVRYGVPVLVVVFQNRLYGTIAMHQARSKLQLAGVSIGEVDIAAMARALGADALEVTDDDQLDDAFTRAGRFDVPRVVVIRTAADAIAPHTSLSAVMGDRGSA